MTHTSVQIHHEEDIAKAVSPRAGQEVPSQSSRIDKKAQHLPKDCEGVSSNIDSRDPCPAITISDEELQGSQPFVGDAFQNFLCNDINKIGGHFDMPVISTGRICHTAFNM